MLAPETKRWFPFLQPRADAKLRLVCLPHAGGGASFYRPWAPLLPPNVELCAGQPPGRETRFAEPAFKRVEDYVASLVTALQPLLDRPFALFGHSMGALMAFEVARALRARGLPAPARLFVSAFRAPHLSALDERTHDLPEPEFIAYLRKLEGTPEEVLTNAELRELFLPLLRRDFELLDYYQHSPGEPLDVPIGAFAAARDTHARPADLEAWREHTRTFLGLRVFQGGHLYPGTEREPLVRAVLEHLPRP